MPSNEANEGEKYHDSMEEPANKRAKTNDSFQESGCTVTPSSKAMCLEDEENDKENDEEIQVTTSNLTNANIHLPHMRLDCGIHPFHDGDKDANSHFCDNCFCYVCDIPAKECLEWKESHCLASFKDKKWQNMRLQKRIISKGNNFVDLADDDSSASSPARPMQFSAIPIPKSEVQHFIERELQKHYSAYKRGSRGVILDQDTNGAGKSKKDQRITEVLADNLKSIVDLNMESSGKQTSKMDGDIPQLSLQNNFFVEGIKIGWPYPSIMPPQRQMAVHIIRALKNRRHVVLESPTGTGKSAAILCATLAWQRWHNNKCLSQEAELCDIEHEYLPIEIDEETHGNKPCKIIYCSRTHSQVAQMVASLKKTPYRPTMAILGSRDRLCIHKQLRPRIRGGGQRSKVDVTQECRTRVRNTEKYRKSMYQSHYNDDNPPESIPGDNNLDSEIIEEVDNGPESDNEEKGESGFTNKSFKTCPHYRQLSSQTFARAAYENMTPNKKLVNCCSMGGSKSKFGAHDIEDLVQFGINPKVRRGIAIYKDENVSSFGIRMEKDKNGSIVVESIKENSAAQKEGSLEPQNVILSVNGTSVKGMSLQRTAQVIRNTHKNEPLILDVAGTRIADNDDEDYSNEAACPYYLSQALSKHSELVFAPYNYVLDPNIRKAVGIELKNSVVVLDEAHNIEDTLREAGSGKFGEIELSDLSVMLAYYSLMARTNENRVDNQTNLRQRTARDDSQSEDDIHISDVAHDLLLFLEKLINFCRESKARFENGQCKIGAEQAIQEYKKFKSPDDKEFGVTYFGPTGYGIGGKPIGCSLFFQRLGLDEQYFSKLTTQVEIFENANRNRKQSEEDRNTKRIDRLSELIFKFAKAVQAPEHFFVSSVVSPNGGFENVLNNNDNGDNLHGTTRNRFRKPPRKFPFISPRTAQYPNRTPPACSHSSCKTAGKTVFHCNQCDGSTPLWESSIVLNLLSPGILMEELSSECHSIVLASGSLAPLKSLCAELNLLPFNAPEVNIMSRGKLSVKSEQPSSQKLTYRLQMKPPPLEANHVVNLEKQLFAVSVGHFKDNTPLTMTFNNIKNQDRFLSKLGDAIASVIERIPRGGILVFLPSYSLLKRCVKAWNPDRDYGMFSQFVTEDSDGSIWDRFLESKGKVIVESTGRQEDFEKARQDYCDQIENHGSCILLAVYRGKMSEGVSFNDDYARGVICVGVPYPSAFDKSVQAKRSYNDEQRKFCHRTDLQPGMDWYKQQAYRAVSQALGRCIRHVGDYGAVVLMDSRYCDDGAPMAGVCRAHSGLPKWMRQHIRNAVNCNYSRLSNVVLGGWSGLGREMARFFSEAPNFTMQVMRMEQEKLRKAQDRARGLKFSCTTEEKQIIKKPEIPEESKPFYNSNGNNISKSPLKSLSPMISQEDHLCIICVEKPRNLVLLPCSHLCLCESCFSSNTIVECPMCRRKIDSSLPVFT